VTKVLYVEDNDDDVYMLKMRLELLGDFEVLAAEDGEKGCKMAAAERPDIILMDLEMPVVDGWEATRRLRGNPQTRDIPIIALSAHALAGERDKAIATGARSLTPSRSNSIGWSQPFGAFSPALNDASP
jgi:two-component system, cell cycle response regulator DivK